MADAMSPEDLAEEFDCLLRRAGIEFPQTRRAAVLTAYADLRGQVGLLHRRYGATAEPANIFRLTPAEQA
jgi:hypothetical protein